MSVNWIFVIGERRALDWVLGTETMAFREHVRTSLIRPRDNVVVYASRGTWHNPTRDSSQVAAIGQVTSEVRRARARVGEELMPQRCNLRLTAQLPSRQGLPFAPLVDRLDFIRKKATWGGSMRRTVIGISDADFALIDAAFRTYAQKSEA